MKESTVKKVINRIKGDRWGKWDDLITGNGWTQHIGYFIIKKEIYCSRKEDLT